MFQRLPESQKRLWTFKRLIETLKDYRDFFEVWLKAFRFSYKPVGSREWKVEAWIRMVPIGSCYSEAGSQLGSLLLEMNFLLSLGSLLYIFIMYCPRCDLTRTTGMMCLCTGFPYRRLLGIRQTPMPASLSHKPERWVPGWARRLWPEQNECV